MNFFSDKDLAEAIRGACEDLRKAFDDSDYVIDTQSWHIGYNEKHHNKCEVCLAGAVMAKSFNLPKEVSVHGVGAVFSDSGLSTKFEALDEFRSGDLYSALGQYYDNVDNCPYHTEDIQRADEYLYGESGKPLELRNPTKKSLDEFISVMLKAADMLEGKTQ